MRDNVSKYQQGDVIFTEIPDSSHGENWHGGRKEKEWGDETLVIEHGEGTGHTHRFENSSIMGTGVEVAAWTDWSKNVVGVEITGGEATLYHEEHNDLVMPAGKYRVTRVQEFDHISRRNRAVID